MSAIVQVPRVFRIGATTVPDPDPGKPAEEAIQRLRGSYSFLATATLEGPELINEQLVYTVVRPPAQTKG